MRQLRTKEQAELIVAPSMRSRRLPKLATPCNPITSHTTVIDLPPPARYNANEDTVTWHTHTHTPRECGRARTHAHSHG